MDRAVSPVVGVVVLIGLTVLLSVTVLGTVEMSVGEPPPAASLTFTVDGAEDRIALTHRGGETLDVARFDILVTVDGDELRHQPPVPFFAADGFESGPEGPFNSASPDTFRAGETATFVIASTNDPQIHSGSRVSLQIRTGNSVIFDETKVAN